MKVSKLTKIYKIRGGDDVPALNGISFELPERGMVFILGRSGSGKSTLLNILSGLDGFDGGDVIFEGKSFKEFTDADRNAYRNGCCGFVFQEYNLIPELTVGENVALALELQGKKHAEKSARSALADVGLEDYYCRKPATLSGGQKQRVAITRAIVKQPKIIFADEPTGALDQGTGRDILQLLKNLSRERLVVVVSHDREFANEFGDRIIELADGKIAGDSSPAAIENSDTIEPRRIKPKMPAAAAFRLGCSSFACHPVRTAVTLMLSVMTLLLTGVALSGALTSYGQTALSAMRDNGIRLSSVMTSTQNSERFLLTDELCEELAARLDCSTIGVLPYEGEISNSEYTYYSMLPCEAAHIDERQLVAMNAHLQGELPRREGEAAITKYSAEVFEELGYLNGGKLAYCDREYTVTGIVDTHLDEAYEQLKTARTDTYSDLSSRFISDITYSAHNIIFIDEGTAQTIKQAVQEEYDGYYFRVLADIKNALPEDFLDGESGYTVRNYIADKIAGMMPETDLIKNIAGALGGIMAVFSVAVMLNLMSQSASDKTLTLGVLKAFGASGRNLAAIFAVQSGLMALATLAVCTAATPALCAALNCALLGQYAAQGMAIFVFGALPALALVAIAATFALLGCSLPALKTARMKSAEILRSL